jgi:hypothetical protein
MHLRLAKRHARERGNQECTITLADLKRQWDKQAGVCPYTGWELENPLTSKWRKLDSHPARASLDRVDSSLGYTPNNIQFVAVIANYAKNSFGEEALLNFCLAVTRYRQLESE